MSAKGQKWTLSTAPAAPAMNPKQISFTLEVVRMHVAVDRGDIAREKPAIGTLAFRHLV